jgi:hypothetical protein
LELQLTIKYVLKIWIGVILKTNDQIAGIYSEKLWVQHDVEEKSVALVTQPFLNSVRNLHLWRRVARLTQNRVYSDFTKVDRLSDRAKDESSSSLASDTGTYLRFRK